MDEHSPYGYRNSPFDYHSDEIEERIAYRVWRLEKTGGLRDEINVYLELLRRELVPVDRMYEIQETPSTINEKFETEKVPWDTRLTYRNKVEYKYLLDDLKENDTILLNFPVSMFSREVVKDPTIYDPQCDTRKAESCPNCGTDLKRKSVADGSGTEYCSVWCLNEVESGG